MRKGNRLRGRHFIPIRDASKGGEVLIFNGFFRRLLARLKAWRSEPDTNDAPPAPSPVDGVSDNPSPTNLSVVARRYANLTVRDDYVSTLQASVKKARRYRANYEEIEDATGVPWQVVACLHMRESWFNFGKHLHNGDDLMAPTTRVPAGRPPRWASFIASNPSHPKDRLWVRSAIDALAHLKRWHLFQRPWSVEEALDRMEAWNGLGYRRRGILTPFLWSGTQFHRKGKYVRDGVFAPEAIDKQLGCAALLKSLGFEG